VPEVARLFVAMARRKPMREVGQAQAVRNQGVEGCIHGRPGSKRQVLLMDEETLREFGLEPGIVRENITTRGLRLAELAAGQQLQVGEALLETSGPCDPCDRMDEIRMGLQEELRGRRGVLCRVIRSGLMRRGDGIHICDGTATKPESGGQT
jgi:MOSC domain-containing protein YiiM